MPGHALGENASFREGRESMSEVHQVDRVASR